MFKTFKDKRNEEWNIITSWNDLDIPNASDGKTVCLCPLCSSGRSDANKKQKCLSVNYKRGTAYCGHCGKRFMLMPEKPTEKVHRKKPVYKKPEEKIKHDIPEELLLYLYKRKITDKVISRNKLGHSVKWFAKAKKEAPCISLPYHKDGIHTGTKYRLPEPKDHTAETGAEPIVYGYDDIKGDTLIWVEGEFDKLAVEVAGFENCVSVPNGAKSAGSLENCKEKLEKITNHIIAGDNDKDGKELTTELIRRLNPARCKLVKWPEGCKDANEVLYRHGPEIVKRCIEDAERMPVKGIVKPSALVNKLLDLYDSPDAHGLSTGWDNVDKLYRVRPGQWTVVTGIPNHGKSEWLDALATNMMINHKWKFGIFSPENNPIEEHLEKFIKKFYGKPYGKGYNGSITKEQAAELAINLDDRLNFIAIDEDIHTMESLIEVTESLVLSEGINGVIYDPWNMIEHNRPSNVSETDYISSALSKVTYMVKKHNIHAWIVAHPTKLQKKHDNTYAPPLPYDISGSAHWNNKCYNAITIHIPNDKEMPENAVKIYVNKIKSRKTGRPGETVLYYQGASGRYTTQP